MKNEKTIGFLKVLVAVLAFVGFAYLGYKSINEVKLGLDLAGGVSITYQAVEENPSAEQMSDTIYKLQQRVQSYSTEAEVYKEGNNRINIDIPGVSDANSILEALGKPGSLIFVDMNGTVLLNGNQVKAAKAGITQDKSSGNNNYIVELTFTEEGAQAFATATAANVGKQIAIVYDGRVISSPLVKQAITGGQAYIDGMESYEIAENLASFIRIGSLSLELQELRSNVVGAKLGQEAISTSLLAGLIGFIVLALFMVAVYRLPGLASVIALGIYVALTACLLEAFSSEITLTLPGIAGILLSVGMAVDANVIIFTRIKEEIGSGKSVTNAVKLGFNKALSAILDGNITTLIAAAVLYFKGSGTVKGFASTLALGIVLSMFTALFVTRFIIDAFTAIGLTNPKLYGSKVNKGTINFLSKRNICFIASLAVILIGFVGMGVNKARVGDLFNYGIDFKGGTLTNVTFNEDMSLEDLSSKVKPVVDGITGDAGTQTTKVKGTNEVIIKTRSLNKDERESLNKALVDNFGVDEQKITAESISATVSSEMKSDAVFATLLATVLMLLYIWFRFKDIRFAASSVIALVHDVLVVAALYALLKWSVGSTFIACMLTIVGYSINATIVIFDRIRENMGIYGNRISKEELVNLSVTETLTRSVNSSLTTFIMVLVLYIVGVSSIREFALPLMAGIVVGTYSSVCLAGAMWYVLTGLKLKNTGSEKSSKSKKN
jgi:protein-export membrane protein, secD/secF family